MACDKPYFNFGEFATIRSQAGLNSHKNERLTHLNQIAIQQMRILLEDRTTKKLEGFDE